MVLLSSVRPIWRVRLAANNGPPLKASTRSAYTYTRSGSVFTRRPRSCLLAGLVFAKSVALATLVEFVAGAGRRASLPLIVRLLPALSSANAGAMRPRRIRLRPPRTYLRGEIAAPSPAASLRSPSPPAPAFLRQAAVPPLRAEVPLGYISASWIARPVLAFHISREVGNGKASRAFNIRWAPAIINVIVRFLVAVHSVDFSFALYLSLHSQSPDP